MKIYSIYIENTDMEDKTKIFHKGQPISIIDKYLKSKNVFKVICYDEKDRAIYVKYKDGDTAIYIYDGKGNRVYYKRVDNYVTYPSGKKAYDDYILKFKRDKLEKILGKEE